jgi:serine/threonine protein phosphatase PrpC
MPDSSPDAGKLVLRHAQITKIGGRDTNEDALGCAFAGDAACFVVSDGVGGHEGGEIASAAVVAAVTESFRADSSPRDEALKSHVERAVESVARHQTENMALSNMSATVVALIVDSRSRRAIWTHVGDTRLYLFRQCKLNRVTKDHSLTQQLVDAGYCTPEQAKVHPLRNNLLVAVGADGGEPLEISPDESEIRGGDAFLLCTDGLWEWVDAHEMEKALAAASAPEQWLEELVRISEENSRMSAKLRDNYTAFALLIEDARL